MFLTQHVWDLRFNHHHDQTKSTTGVKARGTDNKTKQTKWSRISSCPDFLIVPWAHSFSGFVLSLEFSSVLLSFLSVRIGFHRETSACLWSWSYFLYNQAPTDLQRSSGNHCHLQPCNPWPTGHEPGLVFRKPSGHGSLKFSCHAISINGATDILALATQGQL